MTDTTTIAPTTLAPTIELRPFASLGAADHGWLDAHHHFAFANYHDAERVHWGRLRVWNDDAIAPGAGFPPHPHRDMEIITYVRSGAITHEDNLGNRGRTVAGDVQVMSAGTGIAHSEYNLEDETTTLFQIWILPDRQGEKPSWGTRPFPQDARDGRFVTLASGRPGEEDALPIRTDASVLGATLKAGESVDYALGPERFAYLVPASGAVRISASGGAPGGEIEARARDGVAISHCATLRVTALADSEIVLVDTAGV